jgi:hypothetical protein
MKPIQTKLGQIANFYNGAEVSLIDDGKYIVYGSNGPINTIIVKPISDNNLEYLYYLLGQYPITELCWRSGTTVTYAYNIKTNQS